MYVALSPWNCSTRSSKSSLQYQNIFNLQSIFNKLDFIVLLPVSWNQIKCLPHLLMLDNSAFAALLGKETFLLLDAHLVRWLTIWFVMMIKFIVKMRIRIPGQRDRFRRRGMQGIVGFGIDAANQTRINLKNIKMSLHLFVPSHNRPRLSLQFLARTGIVKFILFAR